jgi:hypothetical protein
MKTAQTLLILALLLVVSTATVSEAAPMGTAFTYQGRLIDANETADGYYDFQFKLFDDANVVDGNQVGGDVNVPDVDVIDGYFTVELDLGNVFDGNAVWLDIGVRPGVMNDPNAYTTLSPRQEVTPTPYALHTRWLLVDEALYNVFVGAGTGVSNTTGNRNSAMGIGALYYNTTGYDNTAMGVGALHYNTIGKYNSAMGYYALRSNTTGNSNSAMGFHALRYNTTGYNNTAMGYRAGYSNRTGSGNVFLGYKAGHNETGDNKLYIANDLADSSVLIYGDFSTGRIGIGTTDPSVELDVNGDINTNSVYKIAGDTILSNAGTDNIFVGFGAGENNTGSSNTFVGRWAGWNPSSESQNTFVGYSAGIYGTGNNSTFLGAYAGQVSEGSVNTFLGTFAGYSNTEGYSNTFVGGEAGYGNISGRSNTFVGRGAGYSNTSGTGNVFIGHNAGRLETGSGKLYIANDSADTDVLIYGDFSRERVGIGTTSPDANLHVHGGAMRLGSSGRDYEILEVTTSDTGGWKDYIDWDGIAIGSNTGTNRQMFMFTDGSGSDNIFTVATSQNGGGTWQADFVIQQDGDVGIGTASPMYDLDVNGNIRAIKTVYYGGTEGNANGMAYLKPDYVFEEGYDVMSTEQVEEYLNRENHLPWMTSAKAEKEENGDGIDMTRMAFETVETAENLQIQVIEQNKLIKKHQEEIAELKTENESLKHRLGSIEQRIENLVKVKENLYWQNNQ